MTTISEERTERARRAARAAEAANDGWLYTNELVTAILSADTPALLSARIEGLREARDIANKRAASGFWHAQAVVRSIDARIAELERERGEAERADSKEARE